MTKKQSKTTAPKSKSTDIKFSAMKKLAKEAYTLESHTFEDGSTLSFYPTFPPALVESMFEEIQSAFQSKPEELEINEIMMHNYVLFMLIKHFTHLKDQLKSTTLVGQLDELNSVVDSGYFSKIIEEVFIPSEINKVFEQLAKYGSNVIFLEKMTQKMYENVGSLELKNRDVFEKLGTRINNKNEDSIVQ